MTDATVGRNLAEGLEPPRRSLADTLTFVGVIIGVLILLAWAYNGSEIRPLALISDARNMAIFIDGLLSPDFRNWELYMREMAVSIQVAIWGTFLAILLGIPFGVLSSENLVPWWIYQPIRRLMDSLRAINEFIFALIFITAVGLGPFAGMLAIFIHTTGVLAKLFAEAVEAIDPRPVEGIRATGASRVQEVIFGVIPQVIPLWVSYALYRFESNVRSATVIGLVGAGGIGLTLSQAMSSFAYDEVSAILIIIIVAVTITDLISQQLRKLVI